MRTTRGVAARLDVTVELPFGQKLDRAALERDRVLAPLRDRNDRAGRGGERSGELLAFELAGELAEDDLAADRLGHHLDVSCVERELVRSGGAVIRNVAVAAEKLR